MSKKQQVRLVPVIWPDGEITDVLVDPSRSAIQVREKVPYEANMCLEPSHCYVNIITCIRDTQVYQLKEGVFAELIYYAAANFMKAASLNSSASQKALVHNFITNHAPYLFTYGKRIHTEGL